MADLLIFGPGYTATRIAARVESEGWRVTYIARTPGAGTIGFHDRQAVLPAIAAATHILCSVPPEADGDPVLTVYGDALRAAAARWIGYLSSTGVYGDAAGGWVDEATPIKGRRGGRNAADAAWLALHREARVFRLPGIYGPGRSALDRVAEGRARRIADRDQVFSRIHVEDIVRGVCASLRCGPPGAYNLADDQPCGQNQVIEAACDLLALPWPPMLSLDEARLSPQALAFYAENRRVANGRAKRLLGWEPAYPDYRAGLAAIFAGKRSG